MKVLLLKVVFVEEVCGLIDPEPKLRSKSTIAPQVFETLNVYAITAAFEPQYLTMEKFPPTKESDAKVVKEFGSTSTLEEIASNARPAIVVTPSGIVSRSTPKFWNAA